MFQQKRLLALRFPGLGFFWRFLQHRVKQHLAFSFTQCSFLHVAAWCFAGVTKFVFMCSCFCKQQQFFLQGFMLAVNIGARADGSTVLLARPHGAPHRVGSLQFRVIFLTFGRHRVPRTCIYSFLTPLDWHRFISTNGRLFLFLTVFTSSAVATPRVAQISAPASPVASSGDSDSDSDSV